MRIGIFSDIHSNLEALKVALTFLSKQKVGQYLFVGDLVGYGANPNECIDLVKKLKCFSVAGNHDYGVLSRIDIENFNDAAKQAIVWTKKELNPTSKVFLETFTIQNHFRNFLLVHSTPHLPDSWEYMFTLKQAQNEFKFFKEQICITGHSHCPFIVEKDETKNEFKRITEPRFKIKEKFRYLINVGSIGQPRDGDARNCVALFDTKTNYFELYRLEYDIKLAQKKIIDAGLPPAFAYRLADGK